MILKRAAKRPDILVTEPNVSPVVIETEVMPAINIEAELFSLSKSDRARARCALWSHQFGLQLRLSVNDSLIRSQLCRGSADVLTTADDWWTAMVEHGWSVS